MASISRITVECIKVTQGKRHFFVAKLPAEVVATISYVAVRGGKGDEEGAVQRLLNKARISGIRDFTLAGGDFPNAMVLNWVSSSNKLKVTGNSISFNVEARAAQIIDGQHRIAGISAAIQERKSVGKLELPIVIYENLLTRECADIFLSINTEQKPAPRSLVFDLYGDASEAIVDQAALRARDIAMFLNDSDDSPYCGEIKGPNIRRRGGILLSTAVTAIKPLVADKGIFEQVEISELEMQKKVVLNLYRAIYSKYGQNWEDKSNVFLYAAGFSAALRFLQLKLIPYCNTKKVYTEELIANALDFGINGPIVQGTLKGVGGVDAINQVFDALVAAFKQSTSKKAKIAV
jgi:DNA sulfur modification protein DndB